MRIKSWLTVLLSAFPTVAVARATQLTLPQLVHLNAPQPVYVERSTESAPTQLDEIVPTADLIVHGRVSARPAYLSEDQTELYTDYAVTPLRVMFQRKWAASVPGIVEPIIVKRWGGNTTIDGVAVSVVATDLPPFENGAELILILNAIDHGKFRIAKEPAGALGVAAGKIMPTGRSRLEVRRWIGATAAEFEAEVHRLVR